MKRWFAGFAEAVAAFVAGPTGMTRIDIDQRSGATLDDLLAEWRAMSLPREHDVGGSRRVVAGVDLVRLGQDVEGATSGSSGIQRSSLLRRLDLVIPELRGEARQYFAMAREVMRRLPVE